jgi:glycosyltransferase involved in cell wall biosynthesis
LLCLLAIHRTCLQMPGVETRARPKPQIRPRLKVAFVTDAWIVGGGAERFLFTLLAGLDREKIEPVVFSLFYPGTKASFSASAESLGIPVVRYAITPSRDLRFIADYFRFLRHVRRGRFAAIHASGDKGLGLFAGWLGRVPVRITTIHDNRASKSTPGYWLRATTLGLFATTAVAVSHAVARTLQAHYRVPHQRISVVYNAVDDRFLGVSPGGRAVTPFLGRDTRHVVTVARLHPAKGVDLLLEAFAIVVARNRHVILHIAGDGPLRAALERQAGELHISRYVVFHGLVHDVAGLLMSADIFVLASRSEGLGIAAIEAMAASKPVVASLVGGLPEVVVDGATGLLVPSTRVVDGAGEVDPNALAQAILQLLDSPAVAEAMGRAGRARYETHFAVPAFIDRYQALYRAAQNATRETECELPYDGLK